MPLPTELQPYRKALIEVARVLANGPVTMDYDDDTEETEARASLFDALEALGLASWDGDVVHTTETYTLTPAGRAFLAEGDQ